NRLQPPAPPLQQNLKAFSTHRIITFKGSDLPRVQTGDFSFQLLGGLVRRARNALLNVQHCTNIVFRAVRRFLSASCQCF
ncbi:hypothetical protein TNCV_2946781, partial [Trichonephila clavipes]